MERFSGAGHRAARWGCRVIAVAGLCAILIASADAETVLVARKLLPLKPGATYTFATAQRVKFVGTFTLDVEVLDVERSPGGHPGRVEFEWHAHDSPRHPGFDSSGKVTTVGLPGGRSLNGWWRQGQDTTTSDTQLWLSRRACLELREHGETRYALDRQVRRDGALRLRRTGSTKTQVTINGTLREVAGIVVTSELGDRLVLLDDCEAPLLLEADLPKIQSWRLTEVTFSR